MFMCFVRISEQTAIIYLYSINWLVFITEMECVYCAVETERLSIIHNIHHLYRVNHYTLLVSMHCTDVNPCSRIINLKKVKQSRNRPGVAQRVPGGLGSQISWHSAHEGGEVVTLTHRPPLPPGMFLVLIFTRSWVDPRAKVGRKEIRRWKIQWHHRESIPGPSDY
jgi:hypothetical protein